MLIQCVIMMINDESRLPSVGSAQSLMSRLIHSTLTSFITVLRNSIARLASPLLFIWTANSQTCSQGPAGGDVGSMSFAHDAVAASFRCESTAHGAPWPAYLLLVWPLLCDLKVMNKVDH